MKRRRFLQSLAAFIAWVQQPGGALAVGSEARVKLPDDLSDRLLATERAGQLLAGLGVRPSARGLGGEYLLRFPEEADISVLLHALEWVAPDGSPGSAEAMARQQRELEARDFAAGRVVELSGWLLSQHEARICALAFLL